MDTSTSEVQKEVEQIDNDEMSEYPGDAEVKRLLVLLMKLNDFDDEREAAHVTFYKIPEAMKVNILFEFFKNKEESEEFRDYALFTLFINTATIVSTLEEMGKLEWFSEALIMEYDIEKSLLVKKRIGESIGHVARMRKDKWPKLETIMRECISSTDVSLNQKALELMNGFHCELSGAEKLIVESIMGSNSSLRKPALGALSHNDVDYVTLETLLPIFIMLAERGCSALPSELENGAVWNESTEWCNGEHSLAVDRLYSLAVKICGRCQVVDVQSKGYKLLTEHMERIYIAASEAILNEVACKVGDVHYTALQIISVLSYRHSHRIPEEALQDIVVCCLLAVARELASCMKPCNSTDPDVIEHNFNFATTLGHWHSKPILSRIGKERAGRHFLAATHAFFKSDDWSRRGSAMICWAILGKEWTNDHSIFLMEHATDGLVDEHPRVRAAAAELLAAVFRGSSIDGDSDQLQKMVASLVSLVADKSPQVMASALVALAYFRSSTDLLSRHYSILLPRLIAVLSECPPNQRTAIHACSIEIICHLASLIGKPRFMDDFPEVERVLCSLLSSIDSSFKYYELVRSSVQRLCQVVNEDCQLARILEAIRA